MNSIPARARGFTLIELIIAMVIIGILLAIAIPSYQGYVARATRAEATTLLMRIAAEQEKFFTTFNRYSSSITGARTGPATTAGLGMSNTTQDGASDPRYYQVAVTLTDGNLGYRLTATPQAQQAADECGALVIDHRGNRTAAGTRCW